MKQLLTFAIMAIILAGCSHSSEDKLSPGAKLMCDFYDDMAKQFADANSFDVYQPQKVDT